MNRPWRKSLPVWLHGQASTHSSFSNCLVSARSKPETALSVEDPVGKKQAKSLVAAKLVSGKQAGSAHIMIIIVKDGERGSLGGGVCFPEEC